MRDALLARETWVGTPAVRRRWLAVGVVVGLAVGAFNVPLTAFPLADLGLPTGWAVAGYAHLALLLVAAGSGYDRAGALVGVVAAGATVWWFAVPGISWGPTTEPAAPVSLLVGVATIAVVLGDVGYLVGAGVRHLVAYARARRGQAASASKS
ncbi:hypothetical protein [Halorubellus sp. PRR65]|uniref:hypothetical protein n=1 Tax=Halorubellus sp. PRR65 TaxID=3098148 RepID=UPI002B2572F7|nr:hypothetical protein [Halorubellus sp. PRR65]